MADPRLTKKPSTNDGTLPVMIYDFTELPFTSENIWHAQKAGWPTILTYDGKLTSNEGTSESSKQRKKRIGGKRRANLENADAGAMGRFRLPKSSSEWRDEYPFASTVENNGSTWVGHVDAVEQRKQASLIARFYREHDAYNRMKDSGTPFWFEVRVVNMPQSQKS